MAIPRNPTPAEIDDLIFEPCPSCGLVMVLSRIEPDQPGHDRRIFQCADCGHSEARIVPIEPL